MPLIEQLLSSADNWYEIVSTRQYQYPGVFTDQEESEVIPSCMGSKQAQPRMGHVSDLCKLPHFSGQNHHLLYEENQLSKGHYNDNVRKVNIDGRNREVHVRYAVCKGVMKCSVASCKFTGSKTAKKCPIHPSTKLVSSGNCPVYVVYIYPNDCTENERWITGITKDGLFNSSTSNLHNHPLPKPSKIPAIVHDTVKQVVQCNPGITPSQLNLGLSTAYNMKVHLIFVYLYNYSHN